LPPKPLSEAKMSKKITAKAYREEYPISHVNFQVFIAVSI
jgi:hypothetical protein